MIFVDSARHGEEERTFLARSCAGSTFAFLSSNDPALFDASFRIAATGAALVSLQ